MFLIYLHKSLALFLKLSKSSFIAKFYASDEFDPFKIKYTLNSIFY